MREPMLCRETTPDKLYKYQGIYAGERKLNGTRGILEIKNGRVKLYNRKGVNYTKRLPEIINAAKNIDGDMILDGEIMAFKDGKDWFTGCQKRCSTKDIVKQRQLMKQIPVYFYAFDILYYDGEDFSNESYYLRKLRLFDAIADYEDLIHPHIQALEYYENLNRAWKMVEENSWEGLVLKRFESRYWDGERSYDWLKLKLTDEAIVAVAGFIPSEKKEFQALVLAESLSNGECGRWLGNCGQGFDQRDLEYLRYQKFKVAGEPKSLPSGETYIPLIPFQLKIKHYGMGDDNHYKNAIYLECVNENLIFEYPSALAGVER